jgi:type I restriction enzyme M protein
MGSNQILVSPLGRDVDEYLYFVNSELFPYLKKFKGSAESANTIEYKIGEIFSELKNRIQGGILLRYALRYPCF